MSVSTLCAAHPFQSTLPVRGATYDAPSMMEVIVEFQSTLPVRGATDADSDYADALTFQSTLPVRGATGGGGDGRAAPF